MAPLLVAGLALTASLFAPLGVAGAAEAAATKSIAISGSVSGVSGGRVLVLSAHGVDWAGVIRGHSFRVLVPSKDRTKVRDATVQIVAASGRYVGPVVLKKIGEKKTPACGGAKTPACVDDVVGLGTASGNISLGRLIGENVRGSTPTWFLASSVSTIDKRDAIRAAARNGRPYGAGNLGLVAGGIPATPSHKTKATRAREATSSASGTFESCPTTTDPAAGTQPGQELDCSGVPNVVNVDVNGNGVLNIADRSATSIDASAITIGAKIHTAESTAISYYAPGGITASAISAFLDPVTPAIGDNAIFNFTIASDALFPGDVAGNDVTLSADCGGLAWCTNAMLFNTKNNSVAGAWAKASPPFAFTTLEGKNAGFGANVLLPFGTNVPAEVVPGQLVTVNGVQQGTGATAETTMEVGPYFATTPYVDGATFTGPSATPPGVMVTDSTGNNVNPVGSGTLTLKIERPERLPLPGETTSSGVMDISGLNYNVGITTKSASGPGTPCPKTAISNVSGATIQDQPANSAGFAIVDNTTQDFDPAEANNPGPIEFTLNPSACVTSSKGAAWTPGSVYGVSIGARGTVGNDITAENFQIKA